MKKVIIFLNGLARGGAERVSANLAKYMSEHGIECYLVTETIRDNEYDVPNGVTRISLNITGNKYVGMIPNIVKLRKLFKTINADTLLIMDTAACILSIPASIGQGMKVVVSERNDPRHFHGKKLVGDVAQLLMKAADGYVFQTEDAQKYYSGKLKNEGAVIPNPLFADNLPQPFIGNRKRTIVNLGRLSNQKNQALLIKAFSRLHKMYPDYRLTIYGDGPLKNQLESIIADLKLTDCVELPGNQPDVWNKINDTSMFVLSSNFEGMPNALIEAMALGIPSISSNCPCGGPKELIDDGCNGFLFEVGSEDDLLEKMVYIIEHPAKAHELGKEAVKIREKLDRDLICEKWMTYLKGL